MARNAAYAHATQVNASSYPDDGTSPVGTTEWNEDPDQAGMIGITPTNATRTIASGVVTPTDSICVVAAESSTSDTLDKIAITNTNQYDLIYLFADTGDTITLTHTASPSADGHIFTVSEANETLSTTIPTILMRKGNYWYGYGGGSTTPTDITVADESSDTTCFPLFVTAATGDLAPKSGSNLAFNSSSGVLTATGFAGALTGNVTGDASGSSGSCTGNSATATALATGRTIGGVSFDGTANINLAGVNAAGNQDTTGTATEATNVTAVANNSTDETVYPTFVDGATGTQGIETDTGFTYNPSTGLITATGLTLSGDLTVNGTTTTIDTTNLVVEDPLIQLAKNNSAADTVDIGFWGLYDTSGSTDLYAGLFRDANDSGKWKLFKDNQAAPTTTVNTSGTGYATATLVADIEGDVTGDLTGDASGVADNVVGLAELASGTDGELFTWDSSGDPAKVAVGTSGHVLTSNGAGAAPTFQAASGGSISGDQDYSGLHDIEDLQRLCLEIQADSFDSDGTNNDDRSNEVELYARTIDSNNDGIFCRVKKNGANVYLQIA